MTTTFRVDLDLMRAVSDAFQATVTTLEPISGLQFSLNLLPLPKSLLEASRAKGDNALGLRFTHGPLIIVIISSIWDSIADDDKIIREQRALIDNIERLAAEAGKGVLFKYMPACFVGQDPIKGYGVLSRALFLNVSKTYDPDGFFQRGVPGGHKLHPEVMAGR